MWAVTSMVSDYLQMKTQKKNKKKRAMAEGHTALAIQWPANHHSPLS